MRCQGGILKTAIDSFRKTGFNRYVCFDYECPQSVVTATSGFQSSSWTFDFFKATEDSRIPNLVIITYQLAKVPPTNYQLAKVITRFVLF